MNSSNFHPFKLIILFTFVVLLTSCAAGDAQFNSENPAGFWLGLWHGIISFISLFIHLFNENVAVYEANNTGGWYDFGFLVGVVTIWGGGSHVTYKSSADKKRDKEWDEIGEKVEKKVMHKLKDWAENEEAGDDDWDEISQKVERKLKRKIREWAEKE